MIADEIAPLLNCNMRAMDKGRVVLVDILVAIFGLGSWISVNAMFIQLPILVQAAPEGWSLPSYLSILIQMANIGPVLYFICKRNFARYVKDYHVIAGILFLGAFAMLHMAFNYSETSEIFGKAHSTSLMVGVFFIALVGCTSSVLFFPFIGRFPEYYLVSLLVGEGLSGFLPSGIALVQGIDDSPACTNFTFPNGTTVIIPSEMQPPRFSTKLFFLIIFGCMVLSLVSFLVLNNTSFCEKEKKKRIATDRANGSPSTNSSDRLQNQKKSVLTPYSYGAMLLLQGIISFLSNGSLPSLQSYSCLPYGNEVYHLSVTLVHIANPIACFAAYFVPHKSIKAITLLSSVLTVFVTYNITLAAMSPNPPLVHDILGKSLMVFSWIVCSALIGYTKLSIAALFNDVGPKGLFWYGVCTQVGASLGAAIMFLLINVLQLFHSADVCSVN